MTKTKDIRKKLMDYSLAVIGVLFLISGIISCVYKNSVYKGFHIDECKKITNGFSVNWGDNHIYTSLPTTIDNKNADTVYISKILHKNELGKGNSLLFRNRQGRAKVYIDDILIYDSGDSFNMPFPLGYGSFFKSMYIGDDYEGKLLTITLEPGYNMKAVSGYIPTVFWGSQAAFVKLILKKVFLSLILSLILIIAGIYYVIYGLFGTYKEKMAKMFFLGLFSIDTGLWMLMECHILELFISNMQTVVYLSYITYGMMPVLFVRFMLSYKEFFNKIYLHILFWSGLILNLIQFILAYARIYSLFESQWLNRVYLILTVLGLITALLSLHKMEDKQVKAKLFGGILIIIISTIAELIYFIFINKQNSGNILKFGICIFI